MRMNARTSTANRHAAFYRPYPYVDGFRCSFRNSRVRKGSCRRSFQRFLEIPLDWCTIGHRVLFCALEEIDLISTSNRKGMWVHVKKRKGKTDSGANEKEGIITTEYECSCNDMKEETRCSAPALSCTTSPVLSAFGRQAQPAANETCGRALRPMPTPAPP